MERAAAGERPLCPECRTARLAPIMYGYPHFTDGLKQALEAGELVLGGCFRKEERWACTACGTRYPEEPASR